MSDSGPIHESRQSPPQVFSLTSEERSLREEATASICVRRPRRRPPPVQSAFAVLPTSGAWRSPFGQHAMPDSPPRRAQTHTRRARARSAGVVDSNLPPQASSIPYDSMLPLRQLLASVAAAWLVARFEQTMAPASTPTASIPDAVVHGVLSHMCRADARHPRYGSEDSI